MESAHPHTLGHQILEGFGIAAATGLVGSLALRVGAVVLSDTALLVPRAAVVVGALLLGVVLADMFSGLVHWGFDRFGDEKTPFFGPAFVKPFRLHHTDPKDILHHGFLETNGNTSLATIIPLALLSLLPIGSGAAWALFVVVAMTVASVLAILTNQLHKWSHDASPPAVVAWMQRMHLILPPDEHAKHHVFPHETHYCITTGWLNGVASKVKLWSRMERVLLALKLEVHRDA